MMVGNGVSNLVEDCENDFTQEILVRPVSRYSLILGKIAGSSFASYLCFFFTIICRLRYRRHAHASSVFEVARLLDALMCLAASSLGVLYRNAQGKNSTACGVSNNVTQAKTRVCACAVLKTSSATTSFSQKNLKPRDSATRLFIYWGELVESGIKPGRDRFFAVLRSKGLLPKRLPVFTPATTHSRHSLRVFCNLVKDMELAGLNQVLSGNITYIRADEWAYTSPSCMINGLERLRGITRTTLWKRRRCSQCCVWRGRV